MPRPLLLLLSLLHLGLHIRTAVSACSGRQSYVLSVQMNFTRNMDPTIPAKAQIPLIIAVTHSPSYQLFKVGDHLTDEVAQVAEERSTEHIEERLDRLRDSGSVSSYSIARDLAVDDVTKLEVTAEDAASLLSIMVPLVPSPAWFAGISAHALCADDTFVPQRSGVLLTNFNSGLQRGASLTSDVDPFPEGQTNPVSGGVLETNFATLAFEQGTLGVDWWKIFLGVLVAVAVTIVVLIFVVPRCRRRKQSDIPLTAPDGVQW